jgi:hypothetical protein
MPPVSSTAPRSSSVADAALVYLARRRRRLVRLARRDGSLHSE